MNINNLYNGQIIKNYKDLCDLLEIKCTTGEAKIKQMNTLAKAVDYHKEGRKIVIDNIKSYDIQIEDGRKNNKGSSERVSKYSILDDILKFIILEEISEQVIAKTEANETLGNISFHIFSTDLLERTGLVSMKYRKNRYDQDVIENNKLEISEIVSLKKYKEEIWDGEGDYMTCYNNYITQQARLLTEDIFRNVIKKRTGKILEDSLDRLVRNKLIFKNTSFLLKYKKPRLDEQGNMIFNAEGDIIYDYWERYTDVNESKHIINMQAETLNAWDTFGAEAFTPVELRVIKEIKGERYRSIVDVPSQLISKFYEDSMKRLIYQDEEDKYDGLYAIYQCYEITVCEVALERYLRLSDMPVLKSKQDINRKNLNNIVFLSLAQTIYNNYIKAVKGETSNSYKRFDTVRKECPQLYMDLLNDNVNLTKCVPLDVLEDIIKIENQED